MKTFSTTRLVKNSLRHYGRNHAGLFAGVLLATAVLTGALLVGDSVDYSLRQAALARLGGIDQAVDLRNRYVSEELAQAIQDASATKIRPMLHLRGMAIKQQPKAQINQVQVLGIDAGFWDFSPDIVLELAEYEAAINEKLAKALGVVQGDEISLRILRPDLMARDAALSSREDEPITRVLVTVKEILPDTGLGRYSLTAGQIAPYNAFVNLAWLQEQVEMEGRVNALLAEKGAAPADLEDALRKAWELEHLGLSLREHASGVVQLESDRVFLDEEVARAALAVPGACGTLAYLVNTISKGEKTTPYSFALAGGAFGDLQDNETVINQWLADALNAKPGDTLRVTYYELLSNNDFVEKERSFTVKRVIAMDALQGERDLMPDFPGLSNVESCADWKIGMPMEEELLNDAANEAYWQEFRQTPKLFVSLNAGQAMWANRFGGLTAVRFDGAHAGIAETGRVLRDDIDPAKLGIAFLPVREQALQAVSQAMDFGGLFLGMSFFLILAALILTGLLFVFMLQQRASEFGTLLALGFRPGQIRSLVLMEGGMIALPGAAMGAMAGTVYTRALIFGLSQFWQGAIAHAAIRYHAEPGTVFIGAVSGFMCAMAALALASRRQTKRSARELLTTDAASETLGQRRVHRMGSLILPFVGLIMSIGLAVAVLVAKPHNIVYPFFGIGSLLLLTGLGFGRYALMHLASKRSAAHPTVTSLAIQNMARRRGRSLSVAGLLACGCFLVFSVASMREDLAAHADKTWSGTGGFDLYAEATVPLEKDLAGEATSVVPIRVHDGDDASCLNLNHARTPRMLGIDPASFSDSRAFLPAHEKGGQNLWDLLDRELEDGTVPALVGDSDTAMWGLQKKTDPDKGDILLYRDERGNEVPVKLVGKLPMRLSVFQGTILVSDKAFTRLYPSENGFRLFLINTENAAHTASLLKEKHERHGLDVVPTLERLREFYVVESTYLAMFLVLGGLGLTLGGAGMGIVVLRNVLERRSELAVLHAVGYERSVLLRILFTEHGLLLLAGLAVGGLAAAAAMAPAVLASNSAVSVTLQLALFVFMLACGAASTAMALLVALERTPLAGLRDE